jgi:predicted ATP-grasp superfamily ATP-dependent carboligase
MNNNMPAIVFSLFETSLGVIRSLGQKGIKVTGFDFKKDIGWYSRYVRPLKCPHPLEQEKEFIKWVQCNFPEGKAKIPVFLTSDDFLSSFSRNREVLSNYFLFNLADHNLLEQISNKYSQYQLASKAGIDLPSTWLVYESYDLKKIPDNILYPVFIKGQDVNLWRKEIDGTVKGFLVNDSKELYEKVKEIVTKNVPVILQEVIEGPDTNHYKYCSYTTSGGEILAEFTLQKIRQNPIHFGVGAVVESIHKQDLIEAGRKLFSAIGFKGIGSAEFKFDNRDGKLKLIEINPRYWQQNYLTTACGINFPYLNYLDLLQLSPKPVTDFKAGIKWVNRYMDFDSFMMYKKEGVLTFSEWRKTLKGGKTYHDFTWDDPLPLFYEIGFAKKIHRIPYYLWKKIFK